MSPKLLTIALIPLFAAATFVAVFFFFYRGSYEPPPLVDIPYEELTSPGAPSGTAADSGIARVSNGLMVIDALHSNFYAERELVSLTSWVANRGYEVEFVRGSSRLPIEEKLLLLEEKLRGADSFLVILPRVRYEEEEVELVEQFVEKGGKLVLISDPTRTNLINTLGTRFGIEFQPDYLYNTVEYDHNFRHIYVRDFQPDPLTSALDTIALFIAGSLRTSGSGVAITDVNTRSSLLEGASEFYPIAFGSSRNVLAVADFTFMVPPYNALLDNDRLLSNVADYLTDSQREYILADFPYFYKGGQGVDVVVGQPSLWEVGLDISNGLSDFGLSSGISDLEDVSQDTLFLGLYEDSGQVGQYLHAAGISIDEVLRIPSAPDLPRESSAIVFLHRGQDRYVLVVLADTPQALTRIVGSLFSGEFREDIISDTLGLRDFS